MSVAMKPGVTALTVSPMPSPYRALRPVELEEGLPGQRLGQPEQAGLGGGVVDLADVAGLADDRGHVDDPAGAALDHVLDRGLGHEEGARQVDRDDLLPVLVGHLGHGPVDGDAGVVHQDVDPAVVVDHLAQHPAAVIGVTDVALVHGDPPVRILGGHARPGTSPRPRGRASKPAATCAPWLASSWQMAAPMPRVPPVTSATRPWIMPGGADGAGSLPSSLGVAVVMSFASCFRRVCVFSVVFYGKRVTLDHAAVTRTPSRSWP